LRVAPAFFVNQLSFANEITGISIDAASFLNA